MKKVLSIVLVLCMLMTFMPTALAASTAPDFSDGWKVLTSSDVGKWLNGGNYYLNEDITIDKSLFFTDNVVLDLNGHIVKFNSSLYGGTAKGTAIMLGNKDEKGDMCTTDFTLQDSNPTAKHYFSKQANGLWKWEPSITEATEGYQLVEGGIVTGGTGVHLFDSFAGGGICIREVKPSLGTYPVNVNINGGNIVGCQANEGAGIYNYQGTLTLNGGNIIGCVATERGGGVFVSSHSRFGMSGGRIEGCTATNDSSTDACVGFLGSTIYIDGGVIKDSVSFSAQCEAERNADINTATAFFGKVIYSGIIRAGIYYGGLEKANNEGRIEGNTYTVKFFENSTDTEPYATALIVGDGTKLVPPTAPKKTDCTFDGWYTENESEYTFDTIVDSNFSLYAKFTHNNHADNNGDGLCDTCNEEVPSTEPTEEKTLRDYIIAVVIEAIKVLIKIIKSYF